MLKDLKLALKLTKYGIQFKQMVGFSIVFLALGLLFIFGGKPTQISMGMLYLMMSLCYFCQSYTSTTISSCVASSGKRRKLLMNIPVIFNGIGGVAGYALGLLAICIKYYVINVDADITSAQISVALLFAGALSMIVQVYMIVCYKYFIISMIVFFGMFFPFYFGADTVWAKIGAQNISLGLGCAAGLVLVILGTALSFLASRLIYRKPFDAWYYKRTIANAMK